MSIHPLVFNRASVSQRRVHPLGVVVKFDVLEDLLPRFLLVLVVPSLHQFPLERLEERFGDRIVIGVAGSGNGLGDPVTGKRLLECPGGVLCALV